MDDEIASQIETSERTLIKDSVLGFDPTMLAVLDDVEIAQDEIENLKSRLGPDLFLYLFKIANSAYHGSFKVGPIKHFFDVVNRIGMQHTKVFLYNYLCEKFCRFRCGKNYGSWSRLSG